MASTHASHQKHPWHLVDPSPWPVMGAISGLVLTVGGVLFMHGHTWLIAAAGFLLALATMFFWWRDVIREGEFGGITRTRSRSACASVWRCSSPRR